MIEFNKNYFIEFFQCAIMNLSKIVLKNLNKETQFYQLPPCLSLASKIWYQKAGQIFGGDSFSSRTLSLQVFNPLTTQSVALIVRFYDLNFWLITLNFKRKYQQFFETSACRNNATFRSNFSKMFPPKKIINMKTIFLCSFACPKNL